MHKLLPTCSLKKWKKAIGKYLLNPDPDATYPDVIPYCPSAEETGEAIKKKIEKLRKVFKVYHKKIDDTMPLADDVKITKHEEEEGKVRMDKTGADPPL